MYEKEQIAERVCQLGAEITAAYPDGDLLVLGLLKGSFIFLSDLVREIGKSGTKNRVNFRVRSSTRCAAGLPQFWQTSMTIAN